MNNQGKYRLIAIVLLAAVLFSVFTLFVFSESGTSVSARAAALYCPDTDSFLFEKNADERMPMASTTKIMTALVAIRRGKLSQRIRIPKEATGIEGSSLYLREGEVLTLEELLYGLMLRSANDAATAIALAISGSVEAFAEAMNEEAAALGLANTHFDNPHGLDSETHYTTAKDLARLGAAAIANETARRIASTYKITVGKGESARLIVNHNKLLRSYEGAIGLKTGFTKKCGRCLVGAAERDGVTLVSTTLSAPDDWNDHKRMLDYGFSALTCYASLKVGEYKQRILLLGGKKSSVTVENGEGFSYVDRAGLSAVTTRVCLNASAAAPIKKGDTLGQILFLRDGVTLGTVPLIATEDVGALPRRRRLFIF